MKISPSWEAQYSRVSGVLLILIRRHSFFKMVSPWISNFFLPWLYTDSFVRFGKSNKIHIANLLELYFFGEKLQAPALRNAVFNHIVHQMSQLDCIVPTGYTRPIYQHPSPSASLRRLWVDIHAWEVTTGGFAEELDKDI